MINIVLHEPEIPYNTGNIGRTCELTGARLHLIRPFGFILNDKMIRRAGMDYWKRLDVRTYIDYDEFLERNPKAREHMFFATTKARRTYADVSYGPDDYIMFGKESAGIPEEILVEHEKKCIRIPMKEGERSLNLASAVAITLYEALRQLDYAGLEKYGELHHI